MNKSLIPTFGLPELLAANNAHSNLSISKQFRQCIEELGVFYLTDHAVTTTDYDAVLNTTMEFFLNGSEQEKQTVTNTNPEVRRGYSGLEMESTAQVTDTGLYSDYSMCYSMGLDKNLFPSPQLEHAYKNYFASTYQLGQTVGAAVLKAGGVVRTEGLANFLECDPLLRFRYFPEVPRDRCSDYEPLRMAPHYDISIITLIQQTACANGFVSLQCETPQGYVALPHKPNAIIVLCGAVATLVSNGVIKAPKHHILAPPKEKQVGSSRTSSVMFLRPKSDFAFSVAQSKACGLNVIVDSETATFKDWIGQNYVKMRNAEKRVTSRSL